MSRYHNNPDQLVMSLAAKEPPKKRACKTCQGTGIKSQTLTRKGTFTAYCDACHGSGHAR